jgi:hypothetical protein
LAGRKCERVRNAGGDVRIIATLLVPLGRNYVAKPMLVRTDESSCLLPYPSPYCAYKILMQHRLRNADVSILGHEKSRAENMSVAAKK